MANGFIDVIILLTDGCSNVGGDPVEVAASIRKAGIVVNVIGMTGIDENGVNEVQSIARAGGGEYQLVNTNELYASMLNLTRASVQATLESIVNRHLTAALGEDMDGLPPKTRHKALKVVEKLEDQVGLRCLVLLDSSGSMKPLLSAAKANIVALLSGLKARKGQSLVAVASFPGPGGEVLRVLSEFTGDAEILAQGLARVAASGATPTGPALAAAAALFEKQAGGMTRGYIV